MISVLIMPVVLRYSCFKPHARLGGKLGLASNSFAKHVDLHSVGQFMILASELEE